MDAHKLILPRTAHFYTLGQPGPAIRQLWLVTHGYGQTAGDFLENFHPIADDHTLIIAPEALNKFYWKGFDGPPVAGWMTRRHRLDEIADYANYLQTLLDLYLPQLPADVEIVLFGFSQGVATQLRFVMEKQPQCHHLVAWAGMLPEDLDYAAVADYWAAKNLVFAWGNADPFITPERLAMHRQIIAAGGLSFSELPFSGKHEILEAPLKALQEQLASKKVAV